ncbi:MAG TPA: carboxypeptidase-like regulatory domain-containing protein [Flavobacterium sp.]|nr:carboxypeptidase-like regulatory domain-containing protein [Flavobacterium sp.]
MKNHSFFALLLFVSFSVSGQLHGVVKDSITGTPIPYVTISVVNENLATTAEENGEFSINISEKSEKLIFSSLGFEQKTVAISKAAEVRLKPIALPLDEVIISRRLETRLKEIGKSENQIHEAFENAPRIDIKFFPYLPAYKKTSYLKQVGIVTDSKIDDASFKIHIYSVDANGYPGEELLNKDFIVSVHEGVSKTKFNLKNFNLRMPKQGLFIGFEKLMIAKNKVEKTVADPNTKATRTQISYYPLMLYDRVTRDFQYTFANGKWIRKTNQNPGDPLEKMRIYEPAITLILTN